MSDALEGIVARVVTLANQDSSGLDKKEYDFLKQARQVAMDGIEKTAADVMATANVQSPYPTPFLNLSDTQIPRSTLEIFKWCKYFYTFDPLIAGAINALANFPITEVYFEDTEVSISDNTSDGQEKSKESDAVKLYKKIFLKKINIYKLLVEIGIDYYLYGNCFIFGEFTTEKEKSKLEWKSIRRLDPSMVIIDYNPVTQSTSYKWRVPAKVIEIIKRKSPITEYNKIPKRIREAVEKKGAVVLNPDNIYHFARPTDSMGENAVWGTPVIANVLKLLMYRNVLRQAQEAIAREHIVPFRVYYLQSTNDINVSADWNGAAQSFAGELMKSVRDPNYKVVSPVPVGLLNVGGDGRALLLTPEIEQVQGEILAGMNVPREFIFGGISFSGSSVSLKILENQFITYRLLMEDFVQNFCIKRLAVARGEWVNEDDDESLVTVRFNDLKMQDDVQQKQLFIGLNSSGKIPDSYLYKMLGLEPDKIKQQLKAEQIDRIKLAYEIQLKQAEYQFEITKKNMVYQARLQKYQEVVNRIFGIQTIDPATGMQLDAAGQPMMPDEENTAMPPEEFDTGQGAEGAAIPDDQIQDAQEPQMNDIAQIQEMIQTMDSLPPEQQEYLMNKLSPELRQRLMEVKKSMDSGTDTGDTDMRPMPDQRPPRRNTLG